MQLSAVNKKIKYLQNQL